MRVLPNPNNVRQIQQARPQPQRQVQQVQQQVKVQPQKPIKPVVKEDDLPTVDFGEEENERDYMENPKFQEYIGILQPILTEAWTAKNTIEETGEKLIESLKAQGVSLPDFLENVPFEDVEDALSDFGLAPEIFTWLRELYAYIETKIGLFPGNGTVG